MTTYLGATGARELIGWLSGGTGTLELGGPRALALLRPAAGQDAAHPAERPVVQRHVLDYAPYPWVAARPPVPLLPAGVLLLTNAPALLAGLPVPPDATVLVAGERGISRGADGPRLTAEEVAGLAADGGSGHIRVLADGSDSDLARAAWSPALRALLHLHEATFLAVQARAPRLDERGSVLVAVLDGVAGQWPKPFTGLFSGLVKSLALEYPRTAIAASLHERAAPADVLPLAAAELAARHLLPVVLHAGGQRLTLRAVAEPAVRGEAPPLPPDALVVAAGGARGIGAAVLAGLARAYRPRLVILGSTVLDAWTEQDLATPAQDRAAFIRRLVTGPDRVAAREANARFDRLQQARTVAGNLAELRRLCGPDRVRYLPCDLRDPEAVRAALVDLPGPPDLLLMVAGTNRAGAVTTKSRLDFLTVRDLKMHSYLNVKAALAGRPPRRWCNFGSFVGFTGQRGETDYASANDFLTCAAAAGGEGEFTLGWTLWRDTGLGATPMVRAFMAKFGQYTAIPTGEGVAHFTAELADSRGRRATVFFGDQERAAISAALPDYLPFCASPATRPLPFVDRIRPGGRELIAERVFDLDRDGYLRMHQVYGYPTLPGTFVPELAAEAALALVPGRVPVAFENLRLESFLRVYKADRPQAKRIQARLVSGDEVESVVAVRVLGDLIAPNGTVLATDRLHFSVTVRMRDAPVPAPGWTHWDDDGAEPLVDPYHADGSPVLLQGVFRSTRDTRLHPLGRRAALDLDAAAVRRWFPDLVLPSLLLDGLVRVAVLERQEGRWTPVAIPRYVRRIDLYQSHTDASLAASGEPVELYVTPVDIDLESRQPDNRALAVRANGEVILQIKDTVGAIVGYLDQPTGRFVDRSSFDRGVRLPGRRPQRRSMTAKHVPVVSAPPQPAPAAGCPVSGVATGRCPVAHGPKGLPVIGDAPAYFRDPAAYTLLLAEMHGPMVRVCLPKPFVQVTGPAAIEQVLRVNPDNYTRGVLYKGFAGFMGRGLLTLDDRQWRDHRKVVQPAFTPQRLGADAQEAVPATAAVLQRWQQAARRGEPIDIAPDVMSIATRTVGRAILGRDLSEPGLGYAHAAGFATRAMYTATIMGLNELVPDTVPTRYNRTKRRSQRVLDQVIGEVVTARRRSGDLGQDAAGLLLASDLDDQAVADNLRTLLLAGTDTTGQALAWTLYELARHPRARQEVEEEVDRVLGGLAPSPQTRDQLPVTRSAVEEALRLHPPVWQFPRDSIQDEVVAGRDIPGGSTLLLSTYGTHRSAQLWTDPEAYEPARFRDGSAQTRPRHAFFPFGGGRRLCIGRNLAMATLVTATAMISQRYRLTLAGGRPVRSAYYITLSPADGVPMLVRERP